MHMTGACIHSQTLRFETQGWLQSSTRMVEAGSHSQV